MAQQPHPHAKPKLIYFSTRGLTESIRLLLHDAGIDYEEVGVGTHNPAAQPEGFTSLVTAGKLPFDQLPVWEEPHGLVLVQSNSILRHIARTHHYFGSNERDHAHIDQAHEGVIDVQQRVSAQGRIFRTSTNDAQKAEAKETAIKEIAKGLNNFERLLHNHDEGKGFIASATISYADLSLFFLLEFATESGLAHLNGHPLLKAYKERLEARPKLDAYRKSPNRYPFVNPFA